MKLYHNITRFRYLRSISSFSRRKLNMFRDIKEGDLILSCSGFNVRVKDIEYIVRPFNSGWYLSDIEVTDDVGGFHSLVDCCGLKRTRKEIVDNFNPKNFDYDNAWWKEHPLYSKVKVALDAGKEIVDEDGCLLPEFWV